MSAAQQLHRSFRFVERDEYAEMKIPPLLRSKWVLMEKTLKDATKARAKQRGARLARAKMANQRYLKDKLLLKKGDLEGKG